MKNTITAEVFVSYNYDTSSLNFEENFTLSPMREYRNRGTNLYQYIDWGNVGLIDDVKDLFTIKTKSRHILYKFVDLDEDERKEYSVEELHYEILSNYDFDELDEFAEDETDNIKIDRHYLILSTRGYSQGDYAEALIPTDELREVWGSDKTDDELVSQKTINHLFWDSPVYLRIDLDLNNTQVEIYSWDIGIDEYWEYPFDIDDAKEIVLNYIKKEYKNVAALDKIVEVVDEAFPTDIK